MPRVHSADIPPTCTEDNRYHLYEAMNRRDERVKVKRAALRDLADCHARNGAKCPQALVADISGGGRVEVARHTLFNFMIDHGECCGTPVGPDWEPSRIVRARRAEAAELRISTQKLQRRNRRTK